MIPVSINKLAFILPLSILTINLQSIAQEVTDGAKYAQNIPLGTARSVGFGGALGSVGGDFGSLSVNPAGIGIYRSSEFLFTPSLRFSGNTGKYNGDEYSESNVRFGLNNIGAVFTTTPNANNYDRAKWKSTSFGFGLNRTADFSRSYGYRGKNSSNSVSQYFENDALNYPNSTSSDEGTPAYMGYQSYLLDNNYYSNVPIKQGLGQQKTIQEKGGITEMVISGGGNYMDKLMIGGTLGINFLTHKYKSLMYEETIDPNASNVFDYLRYTEQFKTTGTGINAKLGIIYKVNEYFRAGVAFHTPTLYTLTDNYSRSLTVESKSLAGLNTITAPENQFEFTYISPFKTVLSGTGMLGKFGFVSVDYELVSYGTMRYRSEDDQQFQDSRNQQIKDLMKTASNIRVGTELRFDNFRVRAGYGFYGSPYKNDLYQNNRSNISFGLGYRFDNAFLDVAIINSSYKTFEQPYILDDNYYTQPNTASINNSLTQGMVTIGWKF
jgi:hypothetical protein